MAQTGYTPLLIYSSSTASQAPSAGNLTNSTLGSELAINITDGKLFYKDNANAVQVIAWKTTPTTAGGTGLTSYTAGDLLYYATGTTLSKLAIGTAYQHLGVNAGATAPEWQPSANSVLTAQGDLLYASAANTLARLAKNTTATRYLANTGTNNNPAWDQINLANGVTGTLPGGNGGTGVSSFTANGVVYASSTSLLATSSNFTYDGSNWYLAGLAGVGTAAVSGYRMTTSSGTSDDSLYRHHRYNSGGGSAHSDACTQTTTGVTTSAKTIAGLEDASLVLVRGKDASANEFMDLLITYNSGTPTVITSKTLGGSPAARTYTIASFNLQLAMGSGTYSINCLWWQVSPR